VKFNIQHAQDPKVGVGQLVAMSSWFKTIETPDKYTAILKSDGPRPATFDLFDYMNIIDKDLATGPDADKKAIGTGAFKLAEWKQGQSITFEKNKNYWQNGKPYLDGITVNLLADQQGLAAQLEGGAADAVYQANLQDQVRLRTDPRYRLTLDEFNPGGYLMGMNTTLGPTKDKRVRQAVSWATDRKRFAETVLLGLAPPQALPWPTFSLAYDESKNNQPHDLDRARKLVQDAGATGAEMDLLYTTGAGTQQVASLSQILHADLEKVGLKPTIRPVEAAASRDLVNNLKYQGVNVAASGYTNLEPSTMFLMSANWTPVGNNEGFDSPEYQRLLAAVGSEPDPMKRKVIYNQLNDLILDECFSLPVAKRVTSVLMRANVNGLRFSQHSEFSLEDVWLG
jgi:peptide/nickel transport system substrate-binding protein